MDLLHLKLFFNRFHFLLLRINLMIHSAMRHTIFLSVLLVTFSFGVNAQEKSKENYFENAAIAGRMHFGFLLAHRERVEHLVRHTSGFEISLSRQMKGDKEWHQFYKYPQTGYSYIFLDFDEPEILGNAHALLAFINFPFVRTKAFQFSMRMSAGLGYLTKKFERVENYKNDVIGSTINAAIQFNFETRYKLSQHLFFNFNVGLTHFSNGSFRTPNLGINNPSVNGGFTYQLHPSKEFIVTGHSAAEKNIQADILYGAGIKEIYPPTGKKYFAHTLSSTLMKPVSHKVRLGAGLDVFYDLSLLRAFRNSDEPVPNDFKIVRSGIHLDEELMIEKLSIVFQMGAYWLDQFKEDGHFYHRIGFKYLLNEHLFANLTLKTHFARADYVECGIGWKFKKL
jgi:hypothetical protein